MTRHKDTTMEFRYSITYLFTHMPYIYLIYEMRWHSLEVSLVID